MNGFASPSFFPSTAADFIEDESDCDLLELLEKHRSEIWRTYRTFHHTFAPSSIQWTNWFSNNRYSYSPHAEPEVPEFLHQDRPKPSNRSGGCGGFQRGPNQTPVRPISSAPVVPGRHVWGLKKALKIIKKPP